ncbi:acid phosphatase det1 [Kappamyces sp. JEL0680]|nr:acid phosphatase det1 [Kappamyces sp. JEL0680]
MILASAIPTSPLSTAPPRAGALSCIPALDDITFWVVELATGKVCDKHTMLNDYVYLTHHMGVSLFKDYFAVTSVQYQTIHFMHVRPSGKLVPFLDLGWTNLPDDALVLSMQQEAEQEWDRQNVNTGTLGGGSETSSSTIQAERSSRVRPDQSVFVSGQHSSSQTQTPIPDTRDQPVIEPGIMSGLKQRIMSYLFRRAKASPNPAHALSHFYLTFSYFSQLVMWKMQFLDDDTIMIKFGSIHNITSKEAANSTFSAFFVLYSLSTTEVLRVYENGSDEMLELVENNDEFRGQAFPLDQFQSTSSSSNNKYYQDNLRKSMYAVRKARNGGHAQSIRRVLSFLPLNPQSFSDSPYFDLDLFSYNDKVISTLDRIRPCHDYAVKFYCRKTGRVKFKVDPNPSPSHTYHRSQKRSVHYIFHPTDPFIMTVQHSVTGPPNVNLIYRAL